MSAAVDRGTIDPLDSVSQQYVANPTRYDGIAYPRCGVSGLCLPRISLGLWNSFGADRTFETQRAIVLRAFNNGVTHFDLANNYGPPPGAAEAHFGRIIARDLRPYRDELIVSSKAGYDMWPGPYGQGGSRKHVLASLDHSLARLGLDYLDVFYSHRFDPHTPLEETMGALATAVRSGRAHYVGISNYDAGQTRRAAAILDDLGIALTVHQPRYNIFDRTPQRGLLQALAELKVGAVAFSPLAGGLLTDRYLSGAVPARVHGPPKDGGSTSGRSPAITSTAFVGAAGAAGHQRLGRCVIRRATGEHPQGAGQRPSGHRNDGPHRRAGQRVIAQTLRCRWQHPTRRPGRPRVRENMKLLVTGGAGYIGSVCAKALLERGHEVVIVDDLSTGNADAVPAGAQFVQDDVAAAAGPVLSDGSFDGVLHFAAKSLVGESVSAPELYWHGNVVKTLALLEAMRAAGTTRLVFSSTAATYGEPEAVPIAEDAPTRPTNAYGATKLAIDHAIASYAVAHGLAATSLRYFNVAGAYAGLGESHAVETHLIPLVLQVAAGRRDEIPVFGTDWPTPDGTAIRDYIHIRDLAEAHVLALESAQPGRHRIYNLGNGTGFSVREVISCCERVTGRPIPSRDVDRRAGDPAVLIASSQRAMSELGWRPRHAGLDEIVADAWAYEQLLRSRTG